MRAAQSTVLDAFPPVGIRRREPPSILPASSRPPYRVLPARVRRRRLATPARQVRAAVAPTNPRMIGTSHQMRPHVLNRTGHIELYGVLADHRNFDDHAAAAGRTVGHFGRHNPGGDTPRPDDFVSSQLFVANLWKFTAGVQRFFQRARGRWERSFPSGDFRDVGNIDRHFATRSGLAGRIVYRH